MVIQMLRPILLINRLLILYSDIYTHFCAECFALLNSCNIASVSELVPINIEHLQGERSVARPYMTYYMRARSHPPRLYVCTQTRFVKSTFLHTSILHICTTAVELYGETTRRFVKHLLLIMPLVSPL